MTNTREQTKTDARAPRRRVYVASSWRNDAPDSLPQTEPRIRRMLSVIESSERIVDESKRMGAVFALRWVLGDEAALSGVADDASETGETSGGWWGMRT